MGTRVSITGLAYGGRGVGRVDGRVVFVPFTAPGDEIEVEITREKKRFFEGSLISLIKPSGVRVDPVCPVFGLCGGCSLQHIRYDEQVRWKELIFKETLRRIGGFHDAALEPAATSPEEFYYRSKVRFHVVEGRWGFFKAGTRDVVDIETCPIADPLINTTFERIRSVLNKKFSETFPCKSLHAVEIGVSAPEARTVASFHFSRIERGFPWATVLKEVGELKGLTVWSGRTRRAPGRRVLALGETTLSYEARGVRYLAPISVFSQANRPQNSALIEKLLSWAALRGDERVLELFSGAGNLTIPLAGAAGAVTTVESRPEATAAARRNASLNGIDSIRFVSSSASKWLEDNAKSLESRPPDMVVLDPPRGGDMDVARHLARIRPKRIIYISCAPPTMARDLSAIAACGFNLVKGVVFDLFPETYHIEGMVLMESEGPVRH